MNPEEARMNRALLQEIARVKRGEQPTDKLAAAVQNPIWLLSIERKFKPRKHHKLSFETKMYNQM